MIFMSRSIVRYLLGLVADPGVVTMDIAGRVVPIVTEADVSRGQNMAVV